MNAFPPDAAPSAAAAVPRSRSRVKLTQKMPTPAQPAPLASARQLSLPSIGSGSAVGNDGENFASEQLSVALSAEMQAQEHLRRVRARVQRELRKAASTSALQTVREHKLEQSRAMRADMDKKVGRDLLKKIAASDIPPATDDEVRKLSEMLNQRLEHLHPDARNFFTLFTLIDVDGSRRISYNELSLLIRDALKVSKAVLPEPRLHALWRVLDDNNSGFVDPGDDDSRLITASLTSHRSLGL